MTRMPGLRGAAGYLLALATPWRSSVRVRVPESGLTFYVTHRDVIGRHIIKYGEHEPVLTRWIAQHLAGAKESGLFVDVGANLGWHSVHAARCPAVKRVVALEPDPFNAELLRRNLAVNGIDKCIVLACAAGEGRGTLRLFRYKDSNRGRHSLIKDFGYGSHEVEIVDLDSALDAAGLGDRPILALKIDVEGFEPSVIAGASKALSRAGAVVLEYSPPLGEVEKLSAMLDRLSAAGFVPHRLGHDLRTQQMSVDDLRQSARQLDTVWLKR